MDQSSHTKEYWQCTHTIADSSCELKDGCEVHELDLTTDTIPAELAELIYNIQGHQYK